MSVTITAPELVYSAADVQSAPDNPGIGVNAAIDAAKVAIARQVELADALLDDRLHPSQASLMLRY